MTGAAITRGAGATAGVVIAAGCALNVEVILNNRSIPTTADIIFAIFLDMGITLLVSFVYLIGILQDWIRNWIGSCKTRFCFGSVL